jgi:hypothetical protein
MANNTLFIGTWKLDPSKDHSKMGITGGSLIYTPTHMGVVLETNNKKTPVISYFGTYEVNPECKIVTHWRDLISIGYRFKEGEPLFRRYEFSTKGNKLRLYPLELKEALHWKKCIVK